ncbi:MAG: hypothetical protein J7K94_07145 [Dehalococcoidia bacterium]|nr:hypothetical protein [Dehalococcoidia bacterium]
MKKIADILALCLEDIASGRSTLEDCLEKYASLRQQLEPLLKIALSIEAPGDIKPSAAFKVRTRAHLLEEIHARRAKAKWWQTGFVAGAQRTVRFRWSRAAAIVVAVLLAVSAIGGGTAYASQDSLPGDVMYPVKLGTENVRLMLTADDASRVRLKLAFAGTRLQEMEALADMGSDKISVAISGYQHNMKAAFVETEQLEGEDASASLSETVALAVSCHLPILCRIEDKAPEEDGEAIERAQEMIGERQISVLRILAGKNPVRATEIKLDVMQHWLERADVALTEAKIGGGEMALGQFVALCECGNEIAQCAHGSKDGFNSIDEMNMQCTSNHLAMLGAIYKKVPADMKESVERAMRLSAEGYCRASSSLLAAGMCHNLPEKPQLSDDIPVKVRERILDNLPCETTLPEETPGSNGPGGGGSAPNGQLNESQQSGYAPWDVPPPCPSSAPGQHEV